MGELKSSISVKQLTISYLEYSRSISRPWGISRLVHAIKNVSLNIQKRGKCRAHREKWGWKINIIESNIWIDKA